MDPEHSNTQTYGRNLAVHGHGDRYRQAAGSDVCICKAELMMVHSSIPFENWSDMKRINGGGHNGKPGDRPGEDGRAMAWKGAEGTITSGKKKGNSTGRCQGQGLIVRECQMDVFAEVAIR